MSADRIEVHLTADEALVLFELVTRFPNDDILSVEHGGKEVTLWHLSAALEPILVQPLKPNYRKLLSGARDRVPSRQAQRTVSSRPLGGSRNVHA